MPEAKIVRMQDLEAPMGARLPVAWLDVGGRTEVAVPMARLAEVTHYERKNLYRLVEGDPVLSSYRVVVTTTRDGVPHKTAFLQRPGVLGVLVKMSAARIQDPAKRERVVAFQRWAFETLDRLLFEGLAPAQPPLFAQPVGAALAPRTPQLKGDRERAARMLVGEIVGPGGRLLSYGEISRATGVPHTTLRSMAKRLGVSHLRKAVKTPPQPPVKPLIEPDLARVLAQQAELLALIARRLGA